jgi:hypothetical protein
MDRLRSALGLGISFLVTSQIYPFMLSSAFTARTIVPERGQKPEVQRDLVISFALSVMATLAIVYLLQDGITAIVLVVAGAAGLALYLYSRMNHPTITAPRTVSTTTGTTIAGKAAYRTVQEAAQAASAPPKCYCSPDQYQSIIVVNNQRQLIPNADVYIDGEYVDKTGTDITDMGMIPKGFTPCRWHDVKVIACDGTTATVGLGYFCYPGHMDVWNVIVVPTDKCGGSISYSGPI